MARLSKKELQDVLNSRLSLKDPQFFLGKSGDRWVGNIVSQTFKGKDDYKRQVMIREALEAELGKESAKRVGMLLAYTPDEWNLGEEDAPATGRRKKVG